MNHKIILIAANGQAGKGSIVTVIRARRRVEVIDHRRILGENRKLLRRVRDYRSGNCQICNRHRGKKIRHRKSSNNRLITDPRDGARPACIVESQLSPG